MLEHFFGGLRRVAATAVFMGAAAAAVAQQATPQTPQSQLISELKAAASRGVRLDPRIMAERLLAAGRPDLGYALLEQTLGVDSDDASVHVLMARLARGLGQNDLALSHYHRAIALRPDADVVQTELGAFSLSLGHVEDARRQFALAGVITSDADSAILLEDLARQLPTGDPAELAAAPRRKPWSIELFSGLTLDSNVNAGPDARTVAAIVGGVPLTLTLGNGSQPRDLGGWTNNVSASYLLPLDSRFAVLSQLGVGVTNYFGASEFDTHSLAGGIGLVYREGDVTASLQPNARVVMRDRNRDEMAYGLNGRATMAVDDALRVTGSLGLSHREVPQNAGRDGETYQAGAGIGYALGGGADLSLEYLVQRETARAGVFARWLHGPALALSWPLSRTVGIGASYRYSRVGYHERQALFARTRVDDEHSLGLNLAWDVSSWTIDGLSMRAQYGYTNAASTLELNSYDRHVMTLGLALRF